MVKDNLAREEIHCDHFMYKEYFISTSLQRGQYILQPSLNQLWNTGWNKK